jgi:hypothetical protein
MLRILRMSLVAVVCIGGNVVESSAKIKVQRYAPCQKLYQQWEKYSKKIGATHYAVATSGRRSLSSAGTACGFDAGFGTRAALESSALRYCRQEKKKMKYPGPCQILESE